MARVHGKDAQFSFNAVTFQDELSEIVQSIKVGEADLTAFADAWQVAVAGKKDVVTEIRGSLDTLAGAGDITLFGAIGAGPKSTVFDPTGVGPAANAPEYQCTSSGLSGVIVSRYRLELSVGGAAKYSATLQHSGSTTRAVA